MPAGLQLQPRDVAALADLGEFGLLDTDTIHQRHFPGVTRRRVQQRLRLYREHDITKTTCLSVWFNADQRRGRVPTIHCLTERGAEALQAVTGRRPARLLRGEPKPETLHHRLAVVKTRLAIDDACLAANLLEPLWIMEQDRDPAASGRPLSQQRFLYHAFSSEQKTITCQPDAACVLRIPRNPIQPRTNTSDLLVYWERDRSTESRAQILEKIPGYTLLLDRRPYHRYWPQLGNPTIRVFWVCQSEQRIAALCEKLRDVPVARCFRFTTAAELTPDQALSAPVWQTVERSRREIMRLPSPKATRSAGP